MAPSARRFLPGSGSQGRAVAPPSDRTPGAGPRHPQGPKSLLSHTDSPSVTCIVEGRTGRLVFPVSSQTRRAGEDPGGRTLSAGTATATRRAAEQPLGGTARQLPQPPPPRPPGRSSLPLRGWSRRGPGHTHVLEEGAGVDGDAEAVGAHAVRAQAVQHVRHRAHEAHDHRLAAPEEAVQESGQLSAQQASLGAGPRWDRGWDRRPRPLPRPAAGARFSLCCPSLDSHPPAGALPRLRALDSALLSPLSPGLPPGFRQY